MMNKWNVLLAALDELYGHEGENKSSFKPVNRYFKQETGELVTVIEYKTKKKGEEIILTKKNSNHHKENRNKRKCMVGETKGKTKFHRYG